MNRVLTAVLVASVILAVLVFAAVSSKDSSEDTDRTDNASAQGRKGDDHPGGRVKADKGKHGDHAPPAWSHGRGPKSDKSAREEWKELTPEQRRTLMDRVIREHMAGMREWRKCMVEGRDDCELPVPPGLAKLR